jgi:PHP family Zn ribbon phosphoesterase
MEFHADLHVHSKYSRATSRDLDLEHLAWWAARKGIAVVGTGDCVHPAWLAEIKDKLKPAGNGLFSLKPEIEAEVSKTLPPSCRTAVRFMLSVEISTIYKKGERTRKIHHLIYVPDFNAADRLAASLGRIGNIASDGRPILGLDSRNLLEVALESGSHSYLVPAHIWTPWFAALGSQSGFDSIHECYGDLSGHIFAVETGLSSDPAMNWRVSFLDRYRLTSNSDAHSPGKLGREANRFSFVCVDEFQDVDEPQYRLLQCLAPPAGNICVIGDPNQAIYGFRGATAACFTRFRQDFPLARTMRLGRNYRSTGTIVTAAAQVIGEGALEDITRPMQDPVVVHAASTEQAEAEFVTATIESLLGGHDLLAANREQTLKGAGRPLGFADFAVLYRTGAQSAALRDAFDRAGIPFKRSSPAPIAGHALVRALLGALGQQGTDLRALDLPARIAAAADEMRRDGSDIAALAEAKRWLTALAGAGDEAFLCEQVALCTEADFWDARAHRVSLLTMHAAKGLEFPVVFVVGLEDGLVPFSWGASGAPGAEDLPDEGGPDAEERRLFYVAMTRAKDRLFLSRALQRTWRGQVRTLPPSPYLRDIAADLALHQAPPARRERRGALQYSLF